MEKLTRRSFLKTAGVATGAVAIVGPTGLAQAASASAAEEPATAVQPSGQTPPEMIVAYVRDARRGEVTVLARDGRDHLPRSGAGQAAAEGGAAPPRRRLRREAHVVAS